MVNLYLLWGSFRSYVVGFFPSVKIFAAVWSSSSCLWHHLWFFSQIKVFSYFVFNFFFHYYHVPWLCSFKVIIDVYVVSISLFENIHWHPYKSSGAYMLFCIVLYYINMYGKWMVHVCVSLCALNAAGKFVVVFQIFFLSWLHPQLPNKALT